jgi:hypothetical protein
MNTDESNCGGSSNMSSLLSSLPNNGKLVTILNDGQGIIKKPAQYNFKHAREPLNYREVQRVENSLISLKQYQKMIAVKNEKRKPQVIIAHKRTKTARSH